MPSRRQERVAKRIVQETAAALRSLKHIEFGFITVTRCEVTPDLRNAKVFVSVWGEDETREKAMNTLRNNRTRLKAMIARPLGIKIMPDLHFELDATLETADRISRLIRDARQSDVNPNPLTPEEEAARAAEDPRFRPGATEEEADQGGEGDAFESARHEVEEELLDGDDADADDDPSWRPINLDELPDEDDDEDDAGAGKRDKGR